MYLLFLKSIFIYLVSFIVTIYVFIYYLLSQYLIKSIITIYVFIICKVVFICKQLI